MLGRESSVSMLDAIVVCLNEYLKNNKEKIIKNESDRSDDIETFATQIYGCFDVRMSDVIDNVLSTQNLEKTTPDEFPLPSTFMSNITDEFHESYEATISLIKNHKYKTGSLFHRTGRSELKEKIEATIAREMLIIQDNIRNQEEIRSMVMKNKNSKVDLKPNSVFFNSNIKLETSLLFYTDDPINTNIFFVVPLLTDRLPVCFKSKNFMDGKTSLEVKRDDYGVAIGHSKETAIKQALTRVIKPNTSRHYYCYHSLFSRQEINQLLAEKEFSKVLQSIYALETWVDNAKNINELVLFSVAYDAQNNKFTVNEMPKDIIMNKV